MDMLLLLIFLPLLFAGFAMSSHDDGPDDQSLKGTEGDDLLQGGAGNDTLSGLDGRDMLSGAGGNDVLWAGAGDDGTVQDAADMTDAEIEDLIFGAGTAALQTFIADHTSFGADGGAGNDYVDGGPGNDVVTGGAGNDVVRGSSGRDLIIDLEGANALNGGFGNDDLWGFDPVGTDAPDLLQGWNGDDDLQGDDGDTMEGGEGVDYFYTVWRPGDAPVTITDFDPATEFLQVNTSDLPASPVLQLVDLADDAGMAVTLNGATMAVLQGVTASQFDLNGMAVENIQLVDRVGHGTYAPELAGGEFDEVLRGGDLNDRITTGGGNDGLIGNGGNDTLIAGAGDDTIGGNRGDDLIFAGTGNDLAYGGSGNDSLYMDDGNDTAYGGNGDDLIRGGAGNDSLMGEYFDDDTGNDTIYGDLGNDFLFSGNGADMLFGGLGDDVLSTPINDGGNDTLDGGAGDDILFGYAGSTLTGGTGADVFWSGYDAGETAASTVTDFTPGEDSIEIVVYAAEVIPGFDIQPMGATDTAIVVDGITRLILAGVTPDQIDPTAISIFHSP